MRVRGVSLPTLCSLVSPFIRMLTLPNDAAPHHPISNQINSIQCVSTTGILRRVVLECLEDFEAANVIYLELRTTPRRIKDDDGQEVGKDAYLSTVLDAFSHFTSDTSKKLTPRLIISIDRSRGRDEAIENAALACDMFGSGEKFLVGMDLGGNPTKGSFADYQDILDMGRDKGMKVSFSRRDGLAKYYTYIEKIYIHHSSSRYSSICNRTQKTHPLSTGFRPLRRNRL